MKNFQIPIRVFLIVTVLIIAGAFRARAVQYLNIDYDEDDYTRAAQEYAHLIRTSNWSGFLETNYRPEHPPLAKIVMGVSLLTAPEKDLIADRPTSSEPNRYLPRVLLKPERTVNAVFGWLTVVLLAFVNPLAGLALATHSMTIKYNSQAMLEALPALTSFCMALAYLQFKKSRKTSWLVTSAVFLGLTAASKYLYCVIALAILADWFFTSKERDEVKSFFKQALLWGMLGILIFIVANPFLWANPVQKLSESVFYHAGYSSGAEEVQDAGFPVWQPVQWLVTSAAGWEPDAFFFGPDFLITLLATFGLARLWKKERLYVLWLGFALAFLLFWSTKWPQYILILTVPLSLAAAEGLAQIWQNTIEAFKAKKPVYNKKESRQAIPWLVPGLIAFTVLTLLPFFFQLGVSITDFSSTSIRDGFQGGIWREISGGLTGEIEPTPPESAFNSKEVQYIGIKAYQPIFEYVVVGQGTFIFNILWMIASTGLQVILGLGLAILLNQRGIKLGKFWQTLFILPWAIPEFIGALMWLNIFLPKNGWLNLAAIKYGDAFPLQFLIGWDKTPSLWFFVLLIPAVWYGTPLIMLAANASLKIIPKEIFEAAAIDGANAWQTLQHMTLPLIRPVLLPAIIIRGIYAFNQFYLFQALPAKEGTLANLSYNLFNPSRGFGGGGQFAISAIINIFTVLILVVLVSAFNRRMQTREEFINA